MRTTVTIDADTEALLAEEVARTGMSFKKVINQAIRTALAPRKEAEIKIEPLFREPFPRELPSFNRLSDAWDDEETLRELDS
jgi:hypothetical protein